MITKFNTRNKKEYIWLVEFCNNNISYDFHYTLNNSRVYITDENSLRIFLKNSKYIYVLKENGDYLGIILLWKSFGGNKERYYIKVNAKNPKIARDLLTILLWNVKKDLYVKIRKDSDYINIFKNKGFRFKGGRGIQILLYRKFKPDNFRDPIDKNED